MSHSLAAFITVSQPIPGHCHEPFTGCQHHCFHSHPRATAISHSLAACVTVFWHSRGKMHMSAMDWLPVSQSSSAAEPSSLQP
eukprot:1156163-Pelagomonas_calceolata.AAC.1